MNITTRTTIVSNVQIDDNIRIWLLEKEGFKSAPETWKCWRRKNIVGQPFAIRPAASPGYTLRCGHDRCNIGDNLRFFRRDTENTPAAVTATATEGSQATIRVWRGYGESKLIWDLGQGVWASCGTGCSSELSRASLKLSRFESQGQYWIEYLSSTNNSNYQCGRC